MRHMSSGGVRAPVVCLNVVVLLVQGSAAAVSTGFQLSQAAVISRHGSRAFLQKDPKTLVEASDSLLTIRGMDQMFRAGKFVREWFNRYGERLSSNYAPAQTYVRSSDYSRTISSAQSFLLGLYPPRNQTMSVDGQTYSAPYNMQQVPIHTVAVTNDQLLRGYLKCASFQSKLDQLYNSAEFKSKEKDSQELFKQIKEIAGFKEITLKEFHNVYDYMHLHRTYNRSFINVTERVWRQVVQLADWVEYHKYSQATVGSMGGGVLANEIAANFKKSKDSKGSRRLMYYYSAHHPTIVSLFAALGLSEANTSLRTIPYYASLVFVELLQDKTNSSFVRFSFRNGLEPANPTTYSIPGCSQDPCPLDDFLKLVNSMTVHDVSSWCQTCKNTELPVCRTAGSVAKKMLAMSAAGGFATGVFVTVIVIIIVSAVWHYCLRKRLPRNARRLQGLPDQEIYSSHMGL